MFSRLHGIGTATNDQLERNMKIKASGYAKEIYWQGHKRKIPSDLNWK